MRTCTDAGPPPAGPGSRPRIAASPGASSVRAPARARLPAGLLGQPVEPAGRHVGLELAVPFGRVKFGEPRSELGPFLVGQSADGLFELLDGAHAVRIPAPPAGNKRGRPTRSNSPVFQSSPGPPG